MVPGLFWLKDRSTFHIAVIAKNKYHLDRYFTVSLNKYRKYRDVGKSIGGKIIQKYHPSYNYDNACKLLKINFNNDTIFFKSDVEMNHLTEFVINDIQDHGKNLIQKYQQEVGGETKIEKGILDAIAVAYTSLFSVEKINTAKSTILLHDVLNNTKVTITDYYMALTIQKYMLIFCRIMTFDGITMNFGSSFIFPKELQKQILEKYNIIKEKMKEYPEQTTRYAAFFEINREYGYGVMQGSA